MNDSTGQQLPPPLPEQPDEPRVDATEQAQEQVMDEGAGESADERADERANEGADEAMAQPVVPLAPDVEPLPTVTVPVFPRNVLILGLGLSGLAMARWCARNGAKVTVADTRDAPPQLDALRADLPDAKFIAGDFAASLLEGAEEDAVQLVLRSPGLTPAQVAPVVEEAARRSITVGGELSLFADALAHLRAAQNYEPKVLAITGTNGKTTVTSLTGQLIERAGKRVAVAGNIGPTLVDTLAQKLDANELPEVWVLELSSFQLETPGGFEPTAAAVLNVTQDHLDWHGSMDAYAAAKARIFGKSGVMLLNREDPIVMKMLPAPVRLKGGRMAQREYITFGADAPQRAGDFGMDVVNGMAWLVRAHDADETRRKRGEEAEEVYIQRLMPADALRIRGRHNAVNALSALALAANAGAALGPMLYGLREYRGEPHRVESVGIFNQIEYFDDSKGTNVGATVAALQGLGAERKLIVILGGDGKGQDFSPLAAPVSRYARVAVLIGRDAPLIRQVLASTGVRIVDASTMEEAVTKSSELAHPGDAVLMSPACASFDMFKNYPHRAEVFVAAVRALAESAGQELEGAA